MYRRGARKGAPKVVVVDDVALVRLRSSSCWSSAGRRRDGRRPVVVVVVSAFNSPSAFMQAGRQARGRHVVVLSPSTRVVLGRPKCPPRNNAKEGWSVQCRSCWSALCGVNPRLACAGRGARPARALAHSRDLGAPSRPWSSSLVRVYSSAMRVPAAWPVPCGGESLV